MSLDDLGKPKGSARLRVIVAVAAGAAVAGSSTTRSFAESAVNCGGFAMLGGAQISCSHVAPKQPTQFCTFSWALQADGNVPKVVEGSFVVPPGSSNATVYQGVGFTGALSNPIVLCQGKKSR